MPIDRINWLAVIVGAIIFYFWGFIWYGLLFAKLWSALEGISMATGPDPKLIAISAVVSLVLSFGVAVALSHDDDRTPAHGAQFGIFFGIFFLAALMLQQNAYENHPYMLWLINAGYAVIGLVLLGLLHGAWKKAPATKA